MPSFPNCFLTKQEYFSLDKSHSAKFALLYNKIPLMYPASKEREKFRNSKVETERKTPRHLLE